MEPYPTYDEVFSMVDRNLAFIGLTDIYRTEKRVHKMAQMLGKVYYWFLVVNVAYASTGEFIFCFRALAKISISNLLYFSEGASCALFCLLFGCKTLSMYAMSHEMQKICDDMLKIWPEEKENTREVVCGMMKVAKKFILMFSVSTNGTVTIMNGFPLLMMYIEYLAGRPVVFLLPFYIEYPWDWRNNTTIYVLTYISQLSAGFCVTAGVVAADCLLCALLAQLCMQFRLLSIRVEEMADHTGDVRDDARRWEEAERLRSIVDMHNNIMAKVKEVESIFSLALFQNHLVVSGVMCFLLFALTMSPPINFVKYCTFLWVCLSQSYMLSYYGNWLTIESQALMTSAYQSGWLDSGYHLRRGVQMIQMMSSVPSKINALGFVNLSLETFCSTISMSWSYFTLMRTMMMKFDLEP